MPQPLAVCDRCGHFFLAGIGFDPGATGATGTLTVQSAPRICPKCGGPAHVLGGAYHIAGNTIAFLQGPQRTVSELERLREILQAAEQSGASFEDVKGQVEDEFPGWGKTFAETLVPKTPADFYALIVVILMALDMMLGPKQAGQTVNIEAEQVINNVVNTQAPSAAGHPHVVPSAQPAAPAHAGKKVGRNEPCPCGSGEKYKRCHGSDGATRYVGP